MKYIFITTPRHQRKSCRNLRLVSKFLGIPRRSCYSHNILSITDTYTAGRSSFTSQTKRSCTIAYLTFAHLSYILGVAEILTKSIVIVEGDWRFTPSPDEDGLLNYDYTGHRRTLTCETRFPPRRYIHPRRTHSTAFEARILRRMV
jgi:hypothetical protein